MTMKDMTELETIKITVQRGGRRARNDGDQEPADDYGRP